METKLWVTKSTVILFMSISAIDFYRRNHLDGRNWLLRCVLFNYLIKYDGKEVTNPAVFYF